MFNYREYKKDAVGLSTDIPVGIKLPFNWGVNTSMLKVGVESLEDFVLNSPFIIEEETGLFNISYSTVDQSKSNLLNLLLTRPGERLMHPDYGCDIWSFVFEPNAFILEDRVRLTLQNQITKWLPYIVLINVTAVNKVPEVDNDYEPIGHAVGVTISYSVGTNGSEQTIKLFPGENNNIIIE